MQFRLHSFFILRICGGYRAVVSADTYLTNLQPASHHCIRSSNAQDRFDSTIHPTFIIRLPVRLSGIPLLSGEHRRSCSRSPTPNSSQPVKIALTMSTSGPLDASAGQRSAFPDLETLDELDLECDPSGAQDAFEYLALVRKEARSLPLVMKSELVSTSEKNDHIGPVPNNDPDGQIVLPGDWYSGLAYKFSQSRAKYKTQDTNPVEFSVDMIDCEIDDDGDAVDSYYGDDGEDDEQSDDGEPVESLNEPAADEDSENLQMDLGHNPGSLFRLSRQHMRKYFIDNPPDIDLVCNLSLPQVLRLLFFFTKWISANADEWLYPWIFELLARLPTVLSGSEASIVRELGKKCARLYSRCATVAAKNTMRMVLAIVSQEFGQCDLATVQRQQKTVVPY